jgi:hypothetical protein
VRLAAAFRGGRGEFGGQVSTDSVSAGVGAPRLGIIDAFRFGLGCCVPPEPVLGVFLGVNLLLLCSVRLIQRKI